MANSSLWTISSALPSKKQNVLFKSSTLIHRKPSAWTHAFSESDNEEILLLDQIDKTSFTYTLKGEQSGQNIVTQKAKECSLININDTEEWQESTAETERERPAVVPKKVKARNKLHLLYCHFHG